MYLCIVTSLLSITFADLHSRPLGHERVALAVSLATSMSVSPPGLSVALIAEAETHPMSALLENRLSEAEQIRLVERAELDRVMQEQQLTAVGMTERETAVKMGRLLRADAFVLISVETGAGGIRSISGQDRERLRADRLPPDRLTRRDELLESPAEGRDSQALAGRLIRIRVVETAHGLRLWEAYEQLAPGDAETVSQRIAGTILAVLRKVGAPSGEMVPVGIVDVHRVQLPEKYEPLVRVLPGLLSARLGKEPRIIMLEREDLGTLLREKQLTAGEESAFWNSAVLIDGYLQPGEKNAVEINLRLRKGSGEVLPAVQAAIDSNAVSVAVDRAATEIVKAVLRAPSYAGWDSVKEAAEFYKQGLLLAAHGRRSAATPLFEAAHALQPRTIQYTAALFSNESAPRLPVGPAQSRAAKDSSYSPLELAELAAVLVRQIRDGYHDGLLTASDVLAYRFPWRGTSIRGYFASSASASEEQVRPIDRESRRIWVETCDKALEEESSRIGHFSMALWLAGLAEMRSDEPRQRMMYLREAINAAILPPALGGESGSDDERCLLCDQLLFRRGSDIRNSLPVTPSAPKTDDAFHALWNDYLVELTKMEDPLVRLFALMTQVHAIGYSQGRSAQVRELSAGAVTALQEVRRRFGETITDRGKKRIYDCMGSCLAIASSEDPNATLDLWEKVWTPLIEARDAHDLALWLPYKEPSFGRQSGEADRFFRLLRQVAEVLKAAPGDPEAVRACAFLEYSMRRMQPFAGPMVRDSKSSSPSGSRRNKDEGPLARSVFSEGPSIQAMIREDLLLVTRLSEPQSGEQECSVAAIDLKNFQLISLQTVWHTVGDDRNRWRSIVSAGVIGDTAYMGVQGMGILRVRGLRKQGQRLADDYKWITEEDGLPSSSITGLVEEGTRLWVAYGGEGGESGLSLYDPAAGQWQRILCSTLHGDPPFNAGLPYELRHLTIHGPNCLFFYANLSSPRNLLPRNESSHGLWSIDTSSRELTYFEIVWTNTIASAGDRLLLRTPNYVMEFDPAGNEAVLLVGRFPWGDYLMDAMGKRLTTVGFKKALFLPDAVSRELPFGSDYLGGINLGSAAIHEDTLWARFGMMQLVVIPRGATKDQIQVRDNDLLDGKPVLRFLSTPHGLIAVGEEMVGLIGDSDRGLIRSVRTAGVQSERRTGVRSERRR